MAGYVCFIKILGNMDKSSNTKTKQYIDFNQIKRKFVNNLNYDNFDLNKKDINY